MNSRPGLRIRTLVLLAVAVLALHALILRAAVGPWRVAPPAPSRFVVRTIDAAPVAAAPMPIPVPTEPQRAGLVPVSVEAVPKSTPRPAVRIAAAQPSRPEAQPRARGGATKPAQPVQAFSIPGSARLHYEVTAQTRGLTWRAEGELLWKRDDESYEAQLSAQALFLARRVQRSVGRITRDGLAPDRFSDKGRTEEAAHFERDKGKISFSSNQPDVPLQPGAQDRLSVMLQLSAIVGSQPQQFQPGSTIAIQTASTRTAETWTFTVEETEELRLPGGTVMAVKLTRNPRFEYDQKVELWLAPGMDYVPVRLRLTQPNGDSVDQQWSSTDRG
jgi:hypothetical protein